MSGYLTRIVARGGMELSRRILGIQHTPLHEPVANFKVKTRLKLRCRHCYFLRVEGRLHVECNEHPRHKQREVFDVKLLW
ncbi:unnamed protein product, partial [Mesorhabditis spiculigera]